MFLPALFVRVAIADDAQDELMREAEALANAPAPPPPPQAPAHASFNAMNPGITAFGDMVGQLGYGPAGVLPGSTVYLRSAELEFRADVDPFAKADAVISLEQEAPPLAGGAGSGFGAGPEEAYIDLVALPARLSARLGKFKQPFGIINRMHAHDLPWTDAPNLIGGEGYNDTGASLSWILPLGPAGLTLTAAGVAGEPFDPNNHRAGAAGIGRAELFLGGGPVGVALGGSSIYDFPTGDLVVGGDAMFRFRPSQSKSVVVLGEVVKNEDIAGYGALQVQPARNFYIGAREDFGPNGLKHNLYVSYYTSEFLRVRVGGGYSATTNVADALLQLTFVYGSHPVEPWWVNQ